jgi:hypothetical protein
VEGSPAPVEVLIPEARQHQRQRYRRKGTWAVIGLVIAALIVSAVLLLRGPAAGNKGQTDPKPVAASAAPSGLVYFRPVLCFAAPSAAADTSAGAVAGGTGPLPACAAASQLTAANVDVTPSTASAGYFSRDRTPADPQYASYPSTSALSPGYASKTVLLPGVGGACDGAQRRCVLGPAEMSSRAIGKATATRTPSGQWVVDYTTTNAGAALWDKVAEENFHQLIGTELDGVVYTAPIIQPTQTSFSSFDGRGEIGGLTHSEAVHLAKAISAHKG